jgi:hypothetical protein
MVKVRDADDIDRLELLPHAKREQIGHEQAALLGMRGIAA